MLVGTQPLYTFILQPCWAKVDKVNITTYMLNIGHETTNVNIVHPVIEHKYICIVAKIKGFVFLSTKNVNKNNKV